MGIPPERRVRCRRWLQNLVKSDLLEGVYRQYKEEDLPCKVEDEDGKQDWDIRRGGGRRYLVIHKPDEALVFPIQLQPHQRIAEADLVRARAILTRKGRTPVREPIASPDYDPHRETLFRFGVIRCRHCGLPVDEKNPVFDPYRKRTPWTRVQDELLVEMLGEGKDFDQIAAELARLSEQQTGRHLAIDRRRVIKRKSSQQYHGTLEENRARLISYWEDPFSRRQDCWHLYCCGAGRLAQMRSKRVEEVKAWPEMQHPRKRIGSLSLALEPLLWEAAGKDPRIHVGELPPPPSRQKLNRLDAELARLRRLVSRIQEGYEAGIYTAEEANRRLAPLRAEEQKLAAERDAEYEILLADNDLVELRAQQRLKADVEAILTHPEFRASIAWRRKFVQLVVSEVVVDLATGIFEARTRFDGDALGCLVGQLAGETSPAYGEYATETKPASHQ